MMNRFTDHLQVVTTYNYNTDECRLLRCDAVAFTDVSEERIASIFRVEKLWSNTDCVSLSLKLNKSMEFFLVIIKADS
jgi:hypothetical protein